MRLFFEDPAGDRLALDTSREQWAATYETDDTIITDKHFIIRVEAPEVLRRIEQEADFCGFGYNKDIDDERNHHPEPSLFAEYLTLLSGFVLRVEAAGTSENGPAVDDLKKESSQLVERVDRAHKIGYFDAVEYDALKLIIDDANNLIELYEKTEKAYKEAVESQEANNEPF